MQAFPQKTHKTESLKRLLERNEIKSIIVGWILNLRLEYYYRR